VSTLSARTEAEFKEHQADTACMVPSSLMLHHQERTGKEEKTPSSPIWTGLHSMFEEGFGKSEVESVKN